MSLRLSLFGFELARWRGLLGSADGTIAERVCAALARQVRDAARLAEAQEVARRAVMTGVPFVGLADEQGAHVAAAIALAKADQTLDDLRSDTWNVEPLRDLSTLSSELSGGPFKVLVEGRPIFGRQIKSGWGYYGFLATTELDVLLASLVPIRARLAAVAPPVALAPDARAARVADLKEAQESVADDDTLQAYLARLLDEGVGLGDRTLKDLAFAAAKRRGWAIHVAATRLGGFFARARRAELEANPGRVRGFLDELEGWLSRLASSRRDLFLFTS